MYVFLKSSLCRFFDTCIQLLNATNPNTSVLLTYKVLAYLPNCRHLQYHSLQHISRAQARLHQIMTEQIVWSYLNITILWTYIWTYFALMDPGIDQQVCYHNPDNFTLWTRIRRTTHHLNEHLVLTNPISVSGGFI